MSRRQNDGMTFSVDKRTLTKMLTASILRRWKNVNKDIDGSDQRTLAVPRGGEGITVHLFEFSTFVWIQYIQIDNIFSCLVKSNPVNLVTRHTTYIGPSPTVSVLRSYPVYLERPSIPYSPISDLLVGTPIRIFFCSVQQMIQLWYLGIDEEFVSYLGINKIIFVLWLNVIKMAIM